MKRRTRLRRAIKLDVERFEQPDDVTCGPTCLAKVYRYYGLEKSLGEIIEETPRNPDGGTLAVNLGIGAIREGFRPTIYPFGLRVFDPTWRRLDGAALVAKLRERRATARSARLRRALAAFTEFLELGGRIRFEEPSADLLVEILRQGDPILTGLSATHLYRTPREFANVYDDVQGDSVGHFVVVSGYDPRTDRFVITDPFRNVPLSRTGRYTVPAERLLTAILLGESTYDAVLLVVGRR